MGLVPMGLVPPLPRLPHTVHPLRPPPLRMVALPLSTQAVLVHRILRTPRSTPLPLLPGRPPWAPHTTLNSLVVDIQA